MSAIQKPGVLSNGISRSKGEKSPRYESARIKTAEAPLLKVLFRGWFLTIIPFV